jgi:hypothetical protein
MKTHQTWPISPITLRHTSKAVPKVTILLAATGGAAAPLLVATGVGLGIFQAGEGAYKIIKAKNGDDVEKAFYDILKELCIKYDFKYPDEKMIELAKAVKDLVEGQAKFPDWNKRDDIKSALKVGLILLLDEFGYPPVDKDEVYLEIFEQAENFKKNNQ